ncbi:hypothetical protein KEM55_002743 [Ascosphaera atra]|nr:hypothetical protein KEM55_002743 [Ascosphaera atra]
MSSLFRVVEHVAPGQHIREYPRATANPDETLNIAVKQYIPLENGQPQPGDVTLIFSHANGFPKVRLLSLDVIQGSKLTEIQELYEPLWEEILVRSRGKFRIRSIWIADVAFQGQSSVINESKIGNDPSWMDPPRDLLHFINLKREEFPRPIVGIGHSMGGYPVITKFKSQERPRSFYNFKFNILTTTQASTYRRDIWPSRKEAEASFRRSKFYQSWDPRVLERWIKYGLRELPTAIYPLTEEAKKSGEKPVTLTTPKHQEVFTFSRPAYSAEEVSKLTHPDFVPGVTGNYPFYRAEPGRIFTQLPFLRPSVLYLFGDESDLSAPDEIKDKLEQTGVGPGGSGGHAAGRVSYHTFHGIGHLIPMEVVGESADHIASFLGKELERYKDEEEELWKTYRLRPPVEKAIMDEQWLKHMPKLQRPPKKENAKI